MKYSLPVTWYPLFLTKRPLDLVFNKAATIVLGRISSRHIVWFSHINICIVTKQIRDKTISKVTRFSPRFLCSRSFFKDKWYSYLEIQYGQYGGQNVILFVLSCHRSKVCPKNSPHQNVFKLTLSQKTSCVFRKDRQCKFKFLLSPSLDLINIIFVRALEAMKVAGETLQGNRRTSPAAGSYLQPRSKEMATHESASEKTILRSRDGQGIFGKISAQPRTSLCMHIHTFDLMLFCVVSACVEMNPLPVPWVRKFRPLDSSCIFRSSEMWFEAIIFIKPYKHFILSMWVF